MTWLKWLWHEGCSSHRSTPAGKTPGTSRNLLEVDETSLNVHGKWCYLYRAIDHDGNVVDSLLSEKRKREAARQFFQQAVAVVGSVPDQVTTDGHTASPRAIRETMGHAGLHRTTTSLHTRLEQDHRGIKQRYDPLRAFGAVEAAARLCCAFDELRTSFRPGPTTGEVVSPETTTGFPPASGIPPDAGTRSFIRQ